MRVLLAETDVTTARAIATMLRQGGAIVDQAETGEESLELARHYDYDIVLLDLELTDMDGYDVVRRMRAGRIDTPIVMLSAIARPQAKVKAFALGADDFVTKPFGSGELLARLRTTLRRSQPQSASAIFRAGKIEVDLAARIVRKNGIEIKHPSFDQLTIHADSAIAFATNFPRTMCYLSHPFEA